MEFFRYKKQVLARIDKSNKGAIDPPIQELVERLNDLSEYVTTSSCSGRIGLIVRPRSGKKKDASWICAFHLPVQPGDIMPFIEALPTLPAEPLWFRMEGMILHTCCRTLDAADALVRKARAAGFKRSGIQSVKEERIMVELAGTEVIDALVADEGKMLVSEAYLEKLISEANEKLRKNAGKICAFLSKVLYKTN